MLPPRSFSLENAMHHGPRTFDDDASIRRIGEGLLKRNLPKSEWTHEAHLATCAWLLLERPEIVPERDLPDLIRNYNASVGGVNGDSEGYHETITQVSIRGVRAALARTEGRGLAGRVNALLMAAEGKREWPLHFYSRDRLFSKAARLGWVEPDIRPLDPNYDVEAAPVRRVTRSIE